MKPESQDDATTVPLRVVVVAHTLRTAGGLSVGRNLIEAIVDVGPYNEYRFIVPDGAGYEEVCAVAPNAEVHALEEQSVWQRLKFDTLRLPRQIRSFNPDVVLALESSHASLRPRCPQAVLVHAPHLVYPAKHYGPRVFRDRIRHRFLKWHFSRALKKTQVVFAPTKVMANRLKSEFGFSGRITVCGTSVSRTLLQPAPSSQAAPIEFQRFENHFKLFLPAQYYPHKNIERTIETFRRFRSELTDVVLFITVTPDQHPNVARLLGEIEASQLENHIINLGNITYEDMGQYYQHCDALFLPSTLEVFSATYLEAMANGLPVLTSDLDFAHESCGDSALYFDPWSPRAIKEAIVRLSRDAELRAQLIDNARDGSREMRTWNDIAVAILSDLADLANNKQTMHDPEY